MVFFTPKLIDKRISTINGEISVFKLLGSYSLVIGGYTQSGGLIEEIWGKALRTIKNKIDVEVPRILILGLGAGSAAKVINQYWPQAQITGIEIDQVVVKLAKKYFSLDKIANLKIIQADAISWLIKIAKTKKTKYNLILVDMYIGSKLPKAITSREFLNNLKSILAPKGIALFNRLVIKSRMNEVKSFQKALTKQFPFVNVIPTPANMVFSVYKAGPCKTKPGLI